MTNREEIEAAITDYPIFEYGFLQTDQIMFTDRVRMVCKLECGRYGTSWACPPATGSIEECRNKCLRYPEAFFFSTVHDVKDSQNMTESLQTKVDHEALTDQIENSIRSLGYSTYRLSGDSCAICHTCAYPDPCRFPSRMHPCIESHGILVALIAETCKMEYYIGEHEQLWFSLICYRKEE